LRSYVRQLICGKEWQPSRRRESRLLLVNRYVFSEYTELGKKKTL
jgi:hypothetical protein